MYTLLMMNFHAVGGRKNGKSHFIRLVLHITHTQIFNTLLAFFVTGIR